jgi:hypothetical protein
MIRGFILGNGSNSERVLKRSLSGANRVAIPFPPATVRLLSPVRCCSGDSIRMGRELFTGWQPWSHFPESILARIIPEM